MYEKITNFIEKFDNMKKFGEWKGYYEDYKDGKKTFHAGYFDYNDTVEAFEDAMYDGFTVRDYPDILEKIKERVGTQEIYDVSVSALNANEILACLTGAIRAERFCDGALAGALEDGFITRCLVRLREIDEKQS